MNPPYPLHSAQPTATETKKPLLHTLPHVHTQPLSVKLYRLQDTITETRNILHEYLHQNGQESNLEQPRNLVRNAVLKPAVLGSVLAFAARQTSHKQKCLYHALKKHNTELAQNGRIDIPWIEPVPRKEKHIRKTASDALPQPKPKKSRVETKTTDDDKPPIVPLDDKPPPLKQSPTSEPHELDASEKADSDQGSKSSPSSQDPAATIEAPTEPEAEQKDTVD